MKRIEFIAPVESMRGNLSETQKNIVYPTHDNRAYDGPVGERNTARNYQPIVIGAKRKDGKTYFSVKTKTTNHLTSIAKNAMAAMGGACSIFAAAMKDSAITAKMSAILKAYADHGYVYTYRQLFMPWIRDAVASKSAVIDLSSASITLQIDNPWIRQNSMINVSNDLLVKFWDELAWDPIYFFVGSEKGIAHLNYTFVDLCESNINLLGLEIDDEYNYIKYNGLYLFDDENGDFVESGLEIIPNRIYSLRSI